MMNVYFTVDTESSMAGALRFPSRRPLKAATHIFCRIKGQDYGIGLITQILGAYGFRATHFVEMLSTLVNGDDDTRLVFDFLLAHNQDVQLHIHPVYHFYAAVLRAREAGQPYQLPPSPDLIRTHDERVQLQLLEEAAALFCRFAGRRPIAFRAGCFAANQITIRCLRKIGILIDSSFNPCYPELSFPNENLRANRICQIDGVWEFPVTVARTPLPESSSHFKHADLSSLSVAEVQRMLELASDRGQRHFIMLFHSFSAVKPRNETYRSMRPDHIVIHRLQTLIRFLARHPDRYRVSSFDELAREGPSLREEHMPISELRLIPAAVRKSVQLVNRCYWI